jgi:imidazolonepropionase-like amidohydrolase
MPPMEALKSATVTNAGILGISDQVGTLEPGKSADIIATDENPIDNIRTLENVVFVMKEGIRYK